MEKTISQTIYNDFQDISAVSEKALKLFSENYGKIIEMLNEKLLSESRLSQTQALIEPVLFEKEITKNQATDLRLFLRNWVGVVPVCFLKAVLNEDLELKPTSYRISSTVKSSFSGSVRNCFAFSIR